MAYSKKTCTLANAVLVDVERLFDTTATTRVKLQALQGNANHSECRVLRIRLHINHACRDRRPKVADMQPSLKRLVTASRRPDAEL